MQTKNVLILAASAASGAVAQATGPLPPPPPPPPPPPANGTMIVTTVVDSFVTYCPEPTVFTYAEQCYTATTPGDVTVTNCPCTIEKAVAIPSPPPPPPPPAEGILTLTNVVDSFVTYCPQPTVFNWKEEYYTVTTPGEITITNCPCTVEMTQPQGTPTAGPGEYETGGPMPNWGTETAPAETEAPAPGPGGEESGPGAGPGPAPAGPAPAGTGAGGAVPAAAPTGQEAAAMPGGAPSEETEGGSAPSKETGAAPVPAAGGGSAGEGEGAAYATGGWAPTSAPTYVLTGGADREVATYGSLLVAVLVGVVAM